MSYTIRKLPKEPIIVFKAGPDYDVKTEIEFTMREAMALLNAQEEPVFQILDFSELPSMDMEALMVGTSASARGEDTPMHHPKSRQTIFVTRNPALQMAADGLSDEVFGGLYAPVFENYEDALAFIHAQLE